LEIYFVELTDAALNKMAILAKYVRQPIRRDLFLCRNRFGHQFCLLPPRPNCALAACKKTNIALQCKVLFYMENDALMTIFDLLFIALFLGSAISVAAAVYSALRGRRPRAMAILRWLGVCIGAYFGVIILVSLAPPRGVVRVGDNQCWDDWCIAVTDVRRQPATAAVTYVVTLRVSSRARRRAQRERGLHVYMTDDQGRRYEPAPDT